MTADELDAALIDAIQKSYMESTQTSVSGDALLRLLALAKVGLEAQAKLQILYDIGVTDEDNAELYRRYDAARNETEPGGEHESDS